MFPFRRKKKEEEPKRIYVPVDLVRRYASEGLSEAEIISRLKSQGFKAEHVDRALKIALREQVRGAPETSMEVSPMPGMRAPEIPTEPIGTPIGPEPMGERYPPMGYPPERIVPPREEPAPLGLPHPATEIPAEAPYTYEPREEVIEEYPMEEVSIEEIVEGIIAERWRDFEEILTEFQKRDLQLQGQITDLRKRLREIEESIGKREKTLLARFDEFGESIENIGGRIGSIEKIFRDFLPEFTTNIRTLSELAEKIKEEKNK